MFVCRRLVALLGLCCLLVVAGQLAACGECRYDTDCPSGGLCRAGACEEPTKPPPRRTEDECVTGEQQDCYTGPEGTINRGTCKAGRQTCEGGKWAACREEVKPGKEECDGLDNDCNGQVDEGCDCTDGDTQACYTGSPSTRKKGNCQDGTQRCADGIWGTCLEQKLPQAETCDNQDNDCNGLIDDGVTKKCQSKCGLGEEICRAGKFEACNAPTPSTEVCGDNKDNDCDGSTDEGCECVPNKSRSCYTGPKGTAGQGPCLEGTQTCSADGKWQDCKGQVIPKVEQCNNQDDDCNGSVDDNLKRPCTRGCNSGQEFCQTGKWQGCNAVPADPEVCDSKDNDCNGKVDDLANGKTCECNVGQKETCYSAPQGTLGVGPCKAGERVCESTGKWSICLNQVIPAVEICDGKDNDCDGRIDNIKNSSNPLSKSCYSGTSGTAGKGVCKNGSQTCSAGSWTACVGEVTPSSETCNNKDDNCDGKIDDNLTQNCYSGAAGTQNKGPCKGGQRTCTRGTWSACKGEVTPSAEQCNNKDDDCDGRTDEGGVCNVCNAGQTQSCYTGPSSTRGKSPCRDGSSQCVAGQWGACSGEVKPGTETCNNIDDNCDGSVDNGLTRSCTSSCGSGTEICSRGQWVNCSAPKPKSEVCNNLDDDCNGSIDDGIQCTTLATGDWSGNLFVWNPFSLQKTRSLKINSNIYSVQYSPNKQILAAGSLGKINLWNASTGTAIRTYNNTSSTTGSVRGLSFSPDSSKFAASDGSNAVIWSASASTKIRTLAHSTTVRSIAWHPNSNILAASAGSTVTFWNPSTGAKLNTISTGFTIYSIAINKSGNAMLISGTGSSTPKLELWNISSSPYKRTIALTPTSACAVVVYHTSFSPDGTRATATCPGAAYIWNISTFQRLTTITISGAYFYTAGLTPDNKTFAIGGRQTTSTGHLWIYDVSNNASPIRKLLDTSHTNYLWSLAFRP